MYLKIKKLAEARGETLHKMCVETGVSDSTIANLKTRKSLSAENLLKVAAYYGVTPAYLLSKEE